MRNRDFAWLVLLLTLIALGLLQHRRAQQTTTQQLAPQALMAVPKDDTPAEGATPDNEVARMKPSRGSVPLPIDQDVVLQNGHDRLVFRWSGKQCRFTITGVGDGASDPSRPGQAEWKTEYHKADLLPDPVRVDRGTATLLWDVDACRHFVWSCRDAERLVRQHVSEGSNGRSVGQYFNDSRAYLDVDPEVSDPGIELRWEGVNTFNIEVSPKSIEVVWPQTRYRELDHILDRLLASAVRS